MKRALLLLLLSVLLIAPAGAEAPAPQSPEKPFSVTVGGAAVTIPPPATDFVEVGYDIREQILEVFVVNSNRLLAGFVPAKTLPTLMEHFTKEGKSAPSVMRRRFLL